MEVWLLNGVENIGQNEKLLIIRNFPFHHNVFKSHLLQMDQRASVCVESIIRQRNAQYVSYLQWYIRWDSTAVLFEVLYTLVPNKTCTVRLEFAALVLFISMWMWLFDWFADGKTRSIEIISRNTLCPVGKYGGFDTGCSWLDPRSEMS